MKHISKFSALTQFYMVTYFYQDFRSFCGSQKLWYGKGSPPSPFPSAPTPLYVLDKWNLLRNLRCTETFEKCKDYIQPPNFTDVSVVTSYLKTPFRFASPSLCYLNIWKLKSKSLFLIVTFQWSKIMNFGKILSRLTRFYFLYWQ